MFASFDRSRGRRAMMSVLVDGGAEEFPPRSKKVVGCPAYGPTSDATNAAACDQLIEQNQQLVTRRVPADRLDRDNDHALPGPGSPELAVHAFFAADTSTHTIPLLPSWSAITVSEGALLSSTTVPPAARAAAIRCSATSGAT